LVRSPTAKYKVERLGATPLAGDLGKVEAFASHLRWVDAVIHCAAPVVRSGSWDYYKKNMLDATLAFAMACSRAGVKRFVFISSESVLQTEVPLLGIDESYPYPNLSPGQGFGYGKAKRDVEVYLRSAPFDMETVVIRPPFIWGSGCTALFRFAAKVRAGSFFWINDGASPFEAIHVENLAAAVALALEKGHNRQIYIVTDDQPYTVRSFFTPLFKKLGLPVPIRSFNVRSVRLVTGMIATIWQVLGLKKAPPFTLVELAFFSTARRYNIALARKDLTYTPKVFSP